MLISASLPGRLSALSATVRWGFVTDVAVLAALCGLAGLLSTVLGQAGDAAVGRAFTVLSSGIAIAAAILLALAAWLITNATVVRIAFAVMVYQVVLLVEAIQPGPIRYGQLVDDLALIGVAVLCGLAVRRMDHAVPGWRAVALIGSAVAVAGAVVPLVLNPEIAFQHALDAGTWAATGSAGLALVCCGICDENPLLRRVGLALLTITATGVLAVAQDLPADQPSPALEALGLAAVGMLLAAAVPFTVSALRTVWRELADSQDRLHAAETAMAHSAVRDHEMRNLVAGLSGVESVLAAHEAGAGSPAGRHQLHAAARAELDRLRRMLDSDGLGVGPSGSSSVAVGPLLGDLATLHGAAGAAIELDVADDLWALVPSECLAHIVTNLLVNCARHAPGARVWLSAGRRADRVVLEVADDGPGLPPGLTTQLLRSGAQGPASTGSGLGLAVSAELVDRHGGAIRLVPTPAGGRGCTVVVELPRSPRRVPAAGAGDGVSDVGDATTVLVVDDHELLSSTLVIALSSRGLRARRLTPAELVARLDQPAPPGGLVLLDLDLGVDLDGADLDGAQLVGPLRRVGWRVLVITGTRRESHIAAAVAAGAVGWVPKTAPFDDLVAHAVRAAEGRSLVTDAQRRHFQDVAGAARREAEEFERRWQQLTPREREIMDCLVGGLRAGAIAEKFTVSVATVRTQIRSVLAKLEVSSQLEAVALARQHTP